MARTIAKKLNARTKKLCDSLNAGVDKQKAYYDAGFTGKNWPQTVHGLTAKGTAGGAYLAKIREKRAARVEVDADDLLRQLQAMRIADYSDIIDKETQVYKPIHDWPPIWRQMIASVDVVELFDGTGKEREHIGNVHKIKFMDRSKVLKMFGDHVNIAGFQKQELHLHAHLEGSDARITGARNRSHDLPRPLAPPTPHPQVLEPDAVEGEWRDMSEDRIVSSRSRVFQ